MVRIAITANGPENLLCRLAPYQETVDIWIGADRGALTIVKEKLPLQSAIGDFDSVTLGEKERIREHAFHFHEMPQEKAETDLELALKQALSWQPETIYLFGATGNRKDHEFINLQMLYIIMQHHAEGIIIDRYNQIGMKPPGTYPVTHDSHYPYISFLPMTPSVSGITLEGFKYPLENEKISWGSTLCISNELLGNYGTFSHDEGILMIIKSRDTISS